MDWLFAIIAAFLTFWSIILVVVSLQIDDPIMFWTQRALAFLLLIGAFGVVNVL